MKTALAVIDVQNYYINSYTESLPAKIAEHIKGNIYDFVLFAKFVNNKSSSLSQYFDWHNMMGGDDTDICLELKNFVTDNNVFEKSYYSIFKNEHFVNFLKENDIYKIFLCGFDTDACILASAFDGFDKGYEISILKELSKSHSGEEFDKASIKIIEHNLEKK